MKRLYLLTLFSVLVSVSICLYKNRIPATSAAGEGQIVPQAWLLNVKAPLTPVKDRRAADQTFLTYPEWFLVFSPQEQATYYTHFTATSFPFNAHTKQIWESYRIVNDQIEGNFPPNDGYHLMIKVIGVSATAEYAVKTWYETVVGRLTDTDIPLTGEDKFNAKFTQKYVDFIRDAPWYEFDFKNSLTQLYTEVPFLGGHVFRKLERRYILTSELLVKYAYGKLIALGSKEVYETPLLNTAVVLNNDSLVYLPRYERFMPAARELARSGYQFREIAGNTTAMLVSLIVPADHKLPMHDAKLLFTQPVISDRRWERLVLAVPVNKLAGLLLQLDSTGMRAEHIFDY